MKMKKRLLCILMIAAILLSGISMGVTAADTVTLGKVYVKATQNYKEAQEVLKLVNNERTKRGLNKLKMDKGLCKAAVQRACELSIMLPEAPKHYRPNGKTAHSAGKDILLENCAEGSYRTPKQLVDDWMDSELHRKAILNKSLKSVGVGMVMIEGTNSYYLDDYQFATLEFSKSAAESVEKSTEIVRKTAAVYAKTKYLKKKYFYMMTDQRGDTIKVGKKTKLVPYYDGDYGLSFFQPKIMGKSFNWKSSDKTIATVDKYGNVTGKKAGKVTITATLKNMPSVYMKRTIRVTKSTPTEEQLADIYWPEYGYYYWDEMDY